MTDSLGTIRNLIQADDQPLAGKQHRCDDGSVWELIKDDAHGCFVRHTLSPDSGTETNDMSIEEFLALNCSSPEHAALRILLAGSPPAPTA